MPFFKKHRTIILLSLTLIAAAAIVSVAQLLIFRRPDDTAFYLLQDLAFLPISVLLVTLILGQFLSAKEKRERMEKIHIVVSEFFSEAGVAIIVEMNKMVKEPGAMTGFLGIQPAWKEQEFHAALTTLAGTKIETAAHRELLPGLHSLLAEKKKTVLAMFENPNLLEHDKITDMLWAVYHVADELQNREDFAALPDSDISHLSGDVQRAYRLLIAEWLEYMRHLSVRYPYLFSLAVRKNPFACGDAVVRK